MNILYFDLEGLMHPGWWNILPINRTKTRKGTTTHSFMLFFKFLCMVAWCNETYWKKWDNKTHWYHGMEKLNGKWCCIRLYYSFYLVFILDVYDYTEVLSWRMFWCNVSEPSQNVDAWMFLWPVTGLGFGRWVDFDVEILKKKSGYLTVSHVEVSPKGLADIACMEHLRTHGF